MVNNVTQIPTSQQIKKLPIMEVFGPTIQGEGALIGVPTHFVRLGGCTYRCNWCDTMFAVDPEQVKAGRMMRTPQEIANMVEDLPHGMIRWVTISGGDPMMHKSLHNLVDTLHGEGWLTAIETQGAIFHEEHLLSPCTHLTISPKPPSSGMETDMDILRKYIDLAEAEQLCDTYCVKVVIFTKKDLVWANNLACKLGLQELYLQAGTVAEDKLIKMTQRDQILNGYGWLISECFMLEEDRFPRYPALDGLSSLIILPQLHALLWGNERGK